MRKTVAIFFSFVFLFCLQLELKSFYFQEAALRLLKYEKSISWRKCSSVASFSLFVCEFEYLKARNKLDIFWFYINKSYWGVYEFLSRLKEDDDTDRKQGGKETMIRCVNQLLLKNKVIIFPSSSQENNSLVCSWVMHLAWICLSAVWVLKEFFNFFYATSFMWGIISWGVDFCRSISSLGWVVSWCTHILCG